jgi:hypothetical protein
MGFAERERMADIEEQAVERDYEKLEAELATARGWIETLIEVADNDEEATQNWYIPALTLDYHGYVMEEFWDDINDMEGKWTNEYKNKFFQQYAQNIIDNLNSRIFAARRNMSYESYVLELRGGYK